MSSPTDPQIRDALDNNVEGVILVCGVRGIGKTTALRRVAEESVRPTVWVTINPDEADVPLAGILAILHATDNARLRELGNRLWHEHDSAAPFAVARDMHLVLCDMMLPPTLLIVDNIDLIDAASAQVLGFLSGRLSGTGLSVIASASRDGEPGTLAHVTTVQLSGLDTISMMSFVEKRLRPDSHESFIYTVTMSAEGNPATAVEVIDRCLPQEHTGLVAATMPIRSGPITRDRITTELEGVDSLGRAVLEYVSTARAVTIADLRQVLTGISTMATVDSLVLAGHLRRREEQLSISTFAMRSVIYWGLSANMRAGMHGTLAAVATPSSPAHVWHSSFVTTTAQTSLDLLDCAISIVENEGGHFPFEFVERAIMLGLPAPEAATRLLSLSYSLVMQGTFAVARRYLGLATKLDSSARSQLRAMGLLVQSEYLSRQVLHDTGALDTLAQHSQHAPEEAAIIRAMLVLYRIERWEVGIAHSLSLELREIRDTITDSTGIVAGVLANLDALNYAPPGSDPIPAGPAHPHARSGPASAFLGTPNPTALMLRARYLTYRERYAEARDIYELIRARSTHNDPLWVALARILHAENERLSGNYFGMFDSIKVIMDSNTAPAVNLPYRTLLETLYWKEAGEQKTAVAMMEQLFTRHHGHQNPSVIIRLSGHRGARYLHRDVLDVALQILVPAYTASVDVGCPPLTRLDADMVEVLVRVGDRAEAQRVTDRLARHMERSDSRWGELALLRCRALLAEGDESITLFEHLVSAFSASDNRYEHARTLTAFAVRLDSLGHTERGELLAIAAANMYRQLGLPSWADILDAKRDTNPPPASAVELTPEETRIAEMVMRGMRNYEIATECRMSGRSVEARLTGIYRKLNIHSRGEVAAAITRLRAR